MNIEAMKREIYEHLNLFRTKLQEIQENQQVLAQNQELLATQNNQIIASLTELIQALEAPEEGGTNEA